MKNSVLIVLARTALIATVALAVPTMHAQSIDDLNLQVHGYATQSFLYTNQNSWNGTDSENGSAAWTEAVVNLSAQPESKLRIGVQARYYLLGDYGDTISLDWAQFDYRVNQYFGFRAGKVKTPTGLFNEVQDIDTAYPWALLPQSVYPIASRDSLLSHYGGIVYGTVNLGERNKVEYRAFGGTRIIAGGDSVFQSLRDQVLSLPNGIRGTIYGGTLRWNTPLRGLMFGASIDSEGPFGEIAYGPLPGTISSRRSATPSFFGKYERGRWMLAGEYYRVAVDTNIHLNGLPSQPGAIDYRAWYAMATRKIGSKLTAGAYYSSFMDRAAPVGNSRFQKDWTVARAMTSILISMPRPSSTSWMVAHLASMLRTIPIFNPPPA